MSNLLDSQDANDKDKLHDSYIDFITYKGYVITSLLRITTSRGHVTTLVLLSKHNDGVLIGRMEFILDCHNEVCF